MCYVEGMLSTEKHSCSLLGHSYFDNCTETGIICWLLFILDDYENICSRNAVHCEESSINKRNT